ncbi:MAG TPA: YceI family protein [Acidimicrobiales bacterium]|nr:YceI family protein [Acidimicrobiales bacterium]
MARFRIVPDKSAVLIEATSSLHPIHTRTMGLEGFLDVDVRDGTIEPSADAKGELSLRVERLSSGNRLEDRELQRRIDARRFPTIEGRLAKMAKVGADGRFRVSGDLTFHGVTRRYEDDIVITRVDDDTLELAGESAFDIRDFGMEPPRIFMLRVHPDVKVRIEVVATRVAEREG